MEYRAKSESEQKLGDIIVSTKDSSNKTSYLINLIASAIKREFYANENLGPMRAFKNSLLRANAILHDFPTSIKFIAQAHSPEGTFRSESRGKKFGKIKINRNQKKIKNIAMNQVLPAFKKEKPAYKKPVAIAYGGLVLILVISLTVSWIKQASQDRIKQNLLASVLEKVNQAEAVLLFNDREKARGILEEAEALARDLKNKEVKQDITQKLNQVNLVKNLNNLEVLLLDFLPQDLSLEKDKILVLSADQKTYEANFLSPEPMPTLDYDFTDKFLTFTYQLDPPSQQILRNDSPWLKEELDLTSAQDLAIDGSVYVLYPDTIKKFWKGEAQSFSLEPILAEAKKIFASENNRFIYILEKNRVVKINKDGTLAAQYLSPQFTDLSGIGVSPDDQKIYLLNNKEILKGSLEVN